VTIRRRGRSVVQSGRARRTWTIEFDPTSASRVEPLMGWTTQADPTAGHALAFHTAEAAIRFANRKGWRVHVVGEGLADDPRQAEAPIDHAARRAVDAELEQSFPASDPPSRTLGGSPPDSKRT